MEGLCFSSTTIVSVTIGLTTLPLLPHKPAILAFLFSLLIFFLLIVFFFVVIPYC